MPQGPFIPLQGPNGQTPKAPSVAGWQSPGYEGCGDPRFKTYRENLWYGLRCDGLVVIDCDTPEAAKAWRDRSDPSRRFGTYVRKTPRGFHFLYRSEGVEGAPTAPAVGVLPDIDIRAGAGSQIVFHAPGYVDLGSTWDDIRFFDPKWLPAPKPRAADGEGWSEMPHGRGNVTMTAIAGALRKQGMDERTIRTILMGVNKLTMTESPMPREDVALIARSVCRYEPDPDVGDIEVDES